MTPIDGQLAIYKDGQWNSIDVDIESVLARLRRLEKALHFYAALGSWHIDSFKGTSPAVRDMGTTARAELLDWEGALKAGSVRDTSVEEGL